MVEIKVNVSRIINLDLLHDLVSFRSASIIPKKDKYVIIADTDDEENFVKAVKRIETPECEDRVIVEKLKYPSWRKYDRDLAGILSDEELEKMGIFIRKRHLDLFYKETQNLQVEKEEW